MKKTPIIKTLAVSLIISTFLSCAVVVADRKDNGNHNGWTKNTNNPHHPNTTNPGKGHGKSKKH